MLFIFCESKLPAGGWQVRYCRFCSLARRAADKCSDSDSNSRFFAPFGAAHAHVLIANQIDYWIKPALCFTIRAQNFPRGLCSAGASPAGE
jgi:hypothetical protein